MNRAEEALDAIDTAIEALELLTKQETVDFVSYECISMLTGLVSQKMASQSGIIRDELQRPKRNAA
ncbi:MAG: hypothetical protein AB7D27_02925 [Desulfomicrobium sp.]|jgi:hypothetical protein